MQSQANRRFATYRHSSPPSPDAALPLSLADAEPRGPSSMFWFILHAFCCFVSLALGFRFSRVAVLLLSPPPPSTPPPSSSPQRRRPRPPLPPLRRPPPPEPRPSPSPICPRHVVVGKHGIRIRSWPHSELAEVLRAHEIIQSVHREQRL
ncbi:probable beta-1,4-xylosyltransferase IRX14H [Zingiber officinale]|uniref:probable beta-1,4-xylosyltransferase IRX14H n=1 Tax=Zingiber officinale TaxID=94328 RepID=UPI001C4BABB2|nr:probable beta-1,4-xylosyltransferase IRX14H [Zingiber officinale]